MITPVSEATNARKSVAFSDRIARLDDGLLYPVTPTQSVRKTNLICKTRSFVRFRALTARHTPTSPEKADLQDASLPPKVASLALSSGYL